MNLTKTDVPTSRIQIKNNKTNTASADLSKTATSNQTQPVKVLESKPENTQKNQTLPAKEVSKPVEIKTNEQQNKNTSLPILNQEKAHSSAPSNKTLVQLREYPGQNIQNLAQGEEGMYQ